MFLHLAHRVLSIALATVLTLGMLGSIDRLSQPGTAAANWVQQQESGTRA